MKTAQRNFFSIFYRRAVLRSTGFSPAEDVLAFCGLIHRTPDQHVRLEAFKINNKRSRPAA
jgi:hypothetical protein